MKKSNILLLLDGYKEYFSLGLAFMSFPLIINLVNFYVKKSQILSTVSSESLLFVVFIKWILVINSILLINQYVYHGIDYVINEESRELSRLPILLAISFFVLTFLFIDVFGMSIIEVLMS